MFPVSYAEGFKDVGKMAGFAAAVFGFFFMLGAMLTTNLVAVLPETNQSYLALIFMVLGAFVFVMRFAVIGKHKE